MFKQCASSASATGMLINLYTALMPSKPSTHCLKVHIDSFSLWQLIIKMKFNSQCCTNDPSYRWHKMKLSNLKISVTNTYYFPLSLKSAKLYNSCIFPPKLKDISLHSSYNDHNFCSSHSQRPTSTQTETSGKISTEYFNI